MQINPDGTKTMEAGGEKMIYQWNPCLMREVSQPTRAMRSK
jgi:hypothetical protein